MVSNVLGVGHFNLVTWDFLLFIFDDIILLKLEPFLESYVEYDIVLEMQGTNVKRPIRLIHNSIVDLELGKHGSIAPIVIELNSFDEVTRIICIVLVGLNHGHVALLRLYNVQRQISQIIFVVFCVQETLNFDYAFVVAVWVFGLVIAAGQFKVRSAGVFNDLSFVFNVAL